MAQDFCVVTLTGRIGSIDVKEYNGKKNVRLSVARNVNKKQDNGEWSSVTHWYNVSIWGPHADSLKDKLAKGMRVTIAGDYQVRQYEKDGQKQSYHSIEAQHVSIHEAKRNEPTTKSEENYDDDIPF